MTAHATTPLLAAPTDIEGLADVASAWLMMTGIKLTNVNGAYRAGNTAPPQPRVCQNGAVARLK